jgi:hypothetical protein
MIIVIYIMSLVANEKSSTISKPGEKILLFKKITEIRKINFIIS